MITKSCIDKIYAVMDIVSIVSDYVTLKKNGVNFVGVCPFHGDTNPSLCVSPAKGIFKCFACGKGGNAVAFVMEKECCSYPDALRKIAAKYNIEIEEDEEQTEEDKEKQQKKESMVAIMKEVQNYYTKCLQSNDREAMEARAYAYNRWGEEFCTMMGIGYAPKNGGLLQLAQKLQLNMELMKDLGLIRTNEEKHYDYDFLRNRVTIPICNEINNVVGFTARALEENADAKYLNLQNSLIYSKEKNVFGFNIARRDVKTREKFYAVEGGPDVLRLQILEINSAVACLGSEWTEHQLEILKKSCANICFIPDIDVPKKGERYGVGINKVMKNAARAFDMGMNVSIKEIPSEGLKKVDADEYFTHKSLFDEIYEEDFVIWYANKLLNEEKDQKKQVEAVNTIASMVAKVEDATREALYIEQLAGIFSQKAIWRKAVKNERERLSYEKTKRERRGSEDTQKHGFIIKNNAYYGIDDEGREKEWSNFILKPLFHIQDSVNPYRLFKIVNTNNEEKMVEFRGTELVSLQGFQGKVEGLGDYIFPGKIDNLFKIKKYLYANTETAKEVKQLGWSSEGFYAYGNGVIYREKWYQIDELGIVRLDNNKNYYLPAFSSLYREQTTLYQFERSFVHLDYGKISLREFFSKVVEVYGDNGKIGLCFALATMFKDVITGFTKFPMLNLFGPKGSGKSEFGSCLMSFWIINHTGISIIRSTNAALADTIAQCSNAIVHLDEFKNNIDIEKREFLKGLWDGAGRNRMNMDKDKKREVTKVDCGVIISGQEMATADIALFSRFVFLSFPKSEHTVEETKKFQELKEICKRGLSHLVLQIMKHRELFENNYKENFELVSKELIEIFGTSVESRIWANWAVPLSAFRTLEGVLDTGLSYKEIKDIVTEGCRVQNESCKSNNELSQFWDIVAFLLQDGKIWPNADFRIKMEEKLSCRNNVAAVEFKEPKKILYLRFNRVAQLYEMQGKLTSNNILQRSSVKYYLENSSAYLGSKNAMRFAVMERGVEATKVVPGEKSPQTLHGSTVDQAMCFDYALLQEQYGINLEQTFSKSQSLEDEEDKM